MPGTSWASLTSSSWSRWPISTTTSTCSTSRSFEMISGAIASPSANCEPSGRFFGRTSFSKPLPASENAPILMPSRSTTTYCLRIGSPLAFMKLAAITGYFTDFWQLSKTSQP
jgi:hypothetical protein